MEFEPEEEREVWDTSPITRRTLRNIRLQQVFVPWTSDIFYGLSSLHLDYRGFIPNTISIQMGEFLEVLPHSPRLEKCFLYFAAPESAKNYRMT